MIQIFKEKILATDPRLGRHIHHDSRSFAYKFDTSGLALKSVKHKRRMPIFDQGNIGSCTGNAGIGCLATEPFYQDVASTAYRQFQYSAQIKEIYTFDEAGAVQLYSDATHADDYPGQYPPDDTGSDGLTIAKILKQAGKISGYQHTFSLDDALLALTKTPFITGVDWYDAMFHPDADGRVHPKGSLAGGHEIVADEIDAENERVWFSNSWGDDWGVIGRFYLTFADYGALLARQGDVTIFVPLSQPIPTPIPGPEEFDAELAAVARTWVTRRHGGVNAKMSKALRTWLTNKELT